MDTLTPPVEIFYYGENKKLPEQINLKAGQINIIYENGCLRYIKIGNLEVIRMIYVAVRDHNWDTFDCKIINEQIENREDSFHITYQALCELNNSSFLWNCLITGDSTGTISFKAEGEALSDFKKNRIGFCVLHPTTCAGNNCEVFSSDGTSVKSVFPQEISPHQPFKNISAMTWGITPTLSANMQFEGDIFEMEDHRNWTDASYKTHCTPLNLPYPVEVKKGFVVKQNIKIQFQGEFPNIQSASQALTFKVKDKIFNAVALGICKSEQRKLSYHDISLLKKLRLNHYRLDINFFQPDWEKLFKEGTEESKAIQAGLEIVLHFGDNYVSELEKFNEIVSVAELEVISFLVLTQYSKVTDLFVFNFVRDKLSLVFPNAKIGAGTNIYFTELNRDRIHGEKIDFLSFAVNPQVHAFDNWSLIENTEAQADVIKSTKKFAEDCPVHVSPITLKPRFNPNSKSTISNQRMDELPSSADCRQMSLFNAGWTLSSIKNLSEAGASMATYFEAIGYKGVIQGDDSSPLPGKFYAEGGMIFPVYLILYYILSFSEKHVIESVSSDALIFNGLVLSNEKSKRVILVNHVNSKQRIMLEGLEGKHTLKMIDENNFIEVMKDVNSFIENPGLQLMLETDLNFIELNPYGMAILDFKID